MIKWTEADVLKAFEEAMTPKSPSPGKGGNGRVLIEQMKRMAKQGQMEMIKGGKGIVETR